ncbi:unnamed protein product [Pleuronectes platessa]|uniref:Uncharacterized protein n=1 Tax=Pleuronectes platessa TaxID=8262 RepID=A0A9N7VS28_PLEPL|nr:unnamed protein product [Pleuronectes platessa]
MAEDRILSSVDFETLTRCSTPSARHHSLDAEAKPERLGRRTAGSVRVPLARQVTISNFDAPARKLDSRGSCTGATPPALGSRSAPAGQQQAGGSAMMKARLGRPTLSLLGVSTTNITPVCRRYERNLFLEHFSSSSVSFLCQDSSTSFVFPQDVTSAETADRTGWPRRSAPEVLATERQNGRAAGEVPDEASAPQRRLKGPEAATVTEGVRTHRTRNVQSRTGPVRNVQPRGREEPEILTLHLFEIPC